MKALNWMAMTTALIFTSCEWKEEMLSHLHAMPRSQWKLRKHFRAECHNHPSAPEPRQLRFTWDLRCRDDRSRYTLRVS
jgi:hypothetical protein